MFYRISFDSLHFYGQRNEGDINMTLYQIMTQIWIQTIIIPPARGSLIRSITTARRTMPLTRTFLLLRRFHNTFIVQCGWRHWRIRHLNFCSQNMRSRRKVKTSLRCRSVFHIRIERQPPTECININQSNVIILTFFHPKVGSTRHAPPQQILKPTYQIV